MRKKCRWMAVVAALWAAACQAPSEPEEASYSQPPIRVDACGVPIRFARWPIREAPEVTVYDSTFVAHAYDDCATVTFYYSPEVGQPAYPPCHGHGGTVEYRPDEGWRCMDGTRVGLEEFPRVYQGGCGGLDLGCAYRTYSYKVPREK